MEVRDLLREGDLAALVLELVLDNEVRCLVLLLGAFGEVEELENSLESVEKGFQGLAKIDQK